MNDKDKYPFYTFIKKVRVVTHRKLLAEAKACEALREDGCEFCEKSAACAKRYGQLSDKEEFLVEVDDD